MVADLLEGKDWNKSLLQKHHVLYSLIMSRWVLDVKVKSHRFSGSELHHGLQI